MTLRYPRPSSGCVSPARPPIDPQPGFRLSSYYPPSGAQSNHRSHEKERQASDGLTFDAYGGKLASLDRQIPVYAVRDGVEVLELVE